MAKRKKEVFPTGEIAHLWAHKAQLSARNPQGNFSFAGAELRSYSTCIAYLVKGKGGKTVALHANRSWSHTTAGQQSSGRSATAHMPSFDVAVWQPAQKWRKNGQCDYVVDHKTNLKDFRERIQSAADDVVKARDRKSYKFIGLDNLIQEANDYASAFGLSTTFAEPIGFNRAEELAKAAEYDASAPERHAKARKSCEERRARESAERQARWERERIEREQQREKAPELFAAWRAGGNVNPNDFGRYIPGTFARIVGENIQTTRGAVVPLEHVRRVMPIIRRLYERGESYQRNGHTIHLGHYALDSIGADGTLKAGCHTFARAEVERLFAEIDAIPAQPVPAVA